MAKKQPITFSVRLRQLREAAGLTQRELAGRTGGKVSQPLLAAYELGTSEPSFSRAYALAVALGVALDDLASG